MIVLRQTIQNFTGTRAKQWNKLLLGNPIIDNITNKDVSYDKKQIYSEILEDKKRAEQLLLSAKRWLQIIRRMEVW